MADIAVAGALHLVEIVSSFIRLEINLRGDVQLNVDHLMSWLMTMQAFLGDHEGNECNQMRRDQVRQIRDFAHQIEDIIDEFMFHVPHHFHRHRITQFVHDIYHHGSQRDALHDLSSKIQAIKSKIDNFMMLHPLRMGGSDPQAASSSTTVTGMWSRTVTYWTDMNPEQDELVGFQGLKERILHQLWSDESSRITMSIVGPPGSGKTALAKNVYQDQGTQSRFHFRIWVRAYPSRGKEVLASIASQVHSQVYGESSLGHGPRVNTQDMLRWLQDKRYVVVLDDVWRKEDWDRIIPALPNGLRGSRVIVTSCNREVASACVNNPSYIHHLTGLTWKGARNLFCKKAFPSTNGDCPPDIEEFAEKIVKKCEGLPLAITTVGCLLSRKPQIPVEWKKFHDSLGTDLSVIKSISPSYHNLRARSDLKSCFLYFGVFPEDYSIQRERLIRLWIAEGFVTRKRSQRLEDVAEQNLNELVERNLVHVSKRDVDGRVRSCRVLNLVPEFIVSKSEEENFIRVIGDSSPSSDKVRRLSLIKDNTIFPQPTSGENLNHVRSAFTFGKKSSYNLNLFRLLRVLDMQGASLQSFPETILQLFLLRYLSLQQTNVQEIPWYVKNLSLLETLDLKQTRIDQLPDSIFRLRNLRHLLVYRYKYRCYVTFNGVKGVDISKKIGDLASLEKLSLIKVDADIIKELGRLIHLRKLGIIGLKEKDGKKLCESLQKMPNLSTLDVRSEAEEVYLDLENLPNRPAFEFLQRLHLKGRLRKLPNWLFSLRSLIKISLKWSRLETSPLEDLLNLPNLMELEMVDAYTGICLDFKPSTFKKLKIMRIEQLDQLSMLVVPEGTMPELEKLQICKCGNMKILPLGIEYLSCLEELDVYDMPEEFNDRLRYGDRSLVGHVGVIQSFDSQNYQRSWSKRNRS